MLGLHAAHTAFRGLPDVEVVGHVDANPDEIERKLSFTQAKRHYLTLQDMLDSESPDIVVLCSRHPYDHLEQIRAVAEKGCHIYCEKPISVTLQEADEIVEIAEEHRIKIAMAHYSRYDLGFLTMKKLYDPTGGCALDWDDPEFFWLNEQILVIRLADGTHLATWTSERLSPLHHIRIACSRSTDDGVTWSEPLLVDGPGCGPSANAGWQVPVVAPSGRVYLLYCASDQPGDGLFHCRYTARCSDDGGRSWSRPTTVQLPRTDFDSPDPAAAQSCLSISNVLHDRNGRPLIAYTQWAHRDSDVPGCREGIKNLSCAIRVVRVDNLGDSPDPPDLRLRLLTPDPIHAPHESLPGASFAQEPYVVRLVDSRLFMVMRTNRGEAWCTVSDDDGSHWRAAEPMRNRDDGEVMKQPTSPCPVFEVAPGEYAFLFNNNDGYAFGADSRWDVRNRRPAFVCLGRLQPDAHQPIWWDTPRLFIDNDAVPWGPPGQGRLEAAAYPSMCHHQGKPMLWYPDRKGFLVGKWLPIGR